MKTYPQRNFARSSKHGSRLFPKKNIPDQYRGETANRCSESAGYRQGKSKGRWGGWDKEAETQDDVVIELLDRIEFSGERRVFQSRKVEVCTETHCGAMFRLRPTWERVGGRRPEE